MRSGRSLVLLGVFGLVAGCSSSSSGGSAPTQSAASRTAPAASAVIDRDTYLIKPCPTASPPNNGSWFTAQSIAGKPGAGDFVSTSLVDAGTIAMADGLLWNNGGEYLAADLGSAGVTRLPAGNPHVVLLLAKVSGGEKVVTAVEVRVGSTTPATWKQPAPLGGKTGSHSMALAGHQALDALRAVRSQQDAIDDLGKTSSWLTPCLRYSLATAPPGPSTAVIVRLPGNGAWPEAIGYDKAGKPTDVVFPIGVLPWSLLGLPGKPPPQAVAVEPTASTTSSP